MVAAATPPSPAALAPTWHTAHGSLLACAAIKTKRVRMSKQRLRRSVVAFILLALVASSALRFHSWRRAAEAKEADAVAKELNRQQLWHRKLTHQSSRIIERTSRGLVARGIEPGTRKYKRIMRIRMERRERELVNMKKARERTGVLGNLKDSKEVWLRGGFVKKWGKFNVHMRNRGEEVRAAAELADKIEEKHKLEILDDDYEPLAVCGRAADVGSIEDFETLQKYSECPRFDMSAPILLMEGTQSHGRTGNNLIEFLHAVQEARDNNIQLGIRTGSWAMRLITKMWMAVDGDDWADRFEKTFCIKIFRDEASVQGWNVIHQDTKQLFYYKSELPLGDYMASQEYSIRTLFKHYNTEDNGKGKNMCSAIDSIFGNNKQSAIYSVIHSRTLEGEPGFRLLKHVSRKSGCDPVAALEMRPDYVKSILEPLGMMRYPIVFISDGQNPAVLERLQADPEIGPLITLVPKDSCWIGGDLTLAVMSNAFIGNPASTFTGFIAKARLALGFGHNYLFRARDDNGQWETVCGDHCVFDKTILGVQA